MRKSINLLIASTSLLGTPALADTTWSIETNTIAPVQIFQQDSQNWAVSRPVVSGYLGTTVGNQTRLEIRVNEPEQRITPIYVRGTGRPYSPPQIIYVPEQRRDRVIFVETSPPGPGWQYKIHRPCDCDGRDEHRQWRSSSFYRYDQWEE